MSNLPNNDKEKIKVYVNEYITNVTINRPNLRLLENDLYLENLFVDAVSGILHISGVVSHNDLADVSANQHHNEIHTLNSHSDVILANGAQLEQLTQGGNATSLHFHNDVPSHAVTHIDGTDDILNATVSQKGLMTSTQVQSLNDVVLISTDQTINSNKIINGNIKVNGTFTATSAVFIESETIGLSANYLELNSNETGVPSEDAGVYVNRGTSEIGRASCRERV